MFQHITVLLNEAVEGLNVKPNGIYVDCTLGGGGHSQRIAAKLSSDGILIGLDQDGMALTAARSRLVDGQATIHLVKSNFLHIRKVLMDLGVHQADGILFDLGVSSPQLDEAERGFSYNQEAPLDMRMDSDSDLTAHIVVNEWSEEQLASIIYRYGEERFSRRIARAIVQQRQAGPIHTTVQLAEIVKQSIPAATRRTGPHPAKRTFQAIRIAVNDELGVFEKALKEAIQLLRPGGRVSVITFHSLEDRICKQIFVEQAGGCICPPDFPQCVCGHQQKVRIITKKPILPSEHELQVNPRARSAKLRIAEKLV